MAKTYQVPFFVRLGNVFTTRLLRVGLKPGTMALLTVRGRKSGLPRTTPVSLVAFDGQRWLLAAFGEVDWVRNLRAAGEASLKRGRYPEHIVVKEVRAEEASPVLKHTLANAPGFLLKNFDAMPESPLKDFEREAANHPVFLVQSAAQRQAGTASVSETRRAV